MLASTMKAIHIRHHGGPEVLLRSPLPVPDPGPGETLVRVHYAGINFMDVHTRQGKYQRSTTYPVRLPCTLGMEGAGEVVACGPGAQDFAPGARVAWCLAWGSYAEYAVVPQARLVSVPNALPLDLAAAAVFPGVTAHYLVHDLGQPAPGRVWLVHAATGSIGRLLVQWGAQRGATVLATTGRPAQAEMLRALGAAHVLPYQGFALAVRQATDGQGADVVFDAIGRDTLRESLRAARTRALVVNYGAVSGPLTDLDPLELGEAGSLFLTRPRLADHVADGSSLRRRAAAVFEALLAGRLGLAVSHRYTLDDVEAAHAALEERRATGKAVLVLPAATGLSP